MRRLVVILMLAPCLAGCVKLALRFSPSFIPHLTQSLFEECDPDLAQESLPADLKLMEALLRDNPTNKQLLTALCMGFAGYAMLFVEEEDSQRASQLYLRARDYGLRALDREMARLRGPATGKEMVRARLMDIEEGKLEALFWTALSWNGWINLNLDQPGAMAQLGAAQAFLERVLELNPGYLYGAPYILMGAILAGRPGMLGGDVGRSRDCFERAMALSERRFLLAHYYFARYYAVRIQDRELFLALIKEADTRPAYELKEACLINAVMKRKTRDLMKLSEDLFF
jgi:hypothetical protein